MLRGLGQRLGALGLLARAPGVLLGGFALDLRDAGALERLVALPRGLPRLGQRALALLLRLPGVSERLLALLVRLGRGGLGGGLRRSGRLSARERVLGCALGLLRPGLRVTGERLGLPLARLDRGGESWLEWRY